MLFVTAFGLSSEPPAAPMKSPLSTHIVKPLDTASVRKLYLEGDFDEAILILENGIVDQKVVNHSDSVFAFKHLGVMYAAKYETREKGKYYMHQLLQVEPTARILDMYASEMIYMIFKNIQDEFTSSRIRKNRKENRPIAMDSTKPSALPVSRTQPDRSIKSTKSKVPAYVWIVTTTAAVATGVVAYILLSDAPKTKNNLDAGHGVD